MALICSQCLGAFFYPNHFLIYTHLVNIELYKRLFGFLKPYRKKLSLAILFSVVVGVIASSPVPLIQKTFDDVFVQKDFFMLKAIPIALVILYSVKAVLCTHRILSY